MTTFKNVLSLPLCFMITKSWIKYFCFKLALVFYLFLELVVKKVKKKNVGQY